MLDINMEAGKVSLQDVSMRLENILLAKGDDDGVYQVALATYQGELKYLRQVNFHQCHVIIAEDFKW